MPSGAKKRKAARRKKLKASNNLSKAHGGSDGGEFSSPSSQGRNSPRHKGNAMQVEKREGNSSTTKSILKGSTEKATDGGNTKIDKGSKSKKSYDSSSCFSTSSSDNESQSHAIEKKIAAIDPTHVESLPEKSSHKVGKSTVETSPIVDSVKPVNSLACDDAKNKEKNDSVMAKKPSSSLSEQKVNINEGKPKDNCSTSSVVVDSVLKENGDLKLASLDEKGSAESKNSVAASRYSKGSVSGANCTDSVNESHTPECSVESLPQKTTHKVEKSTVETSPIVYSVKPVNSHAGNAAKHEKNDSVMAKTPSSSFLEQKVNINEGTPKDNCSTSSVVVDSVPKENREAKLASLDEKVSAESKDGVAASTYPKGSVSAVNCTDSVNDYHTPECSVEPLPKKTTQKVEKSTVDSSPIVDSVKSVNSQESDTEKHEKNDSVVAKTPNSSLLEKNLNINKGTPMDNCSTSSVVIDSVLKENGDAKLASLDEKGSAESKESVAASTYPKDSVSGVNCTDHSHTPECSDRQPLLASAPREVERSSWKSCCGILELFSNSNR